MTTGPGATGRGAAGGGPHRRLSPARRRLFLAVFSLVVTAATLGVLEGGLRLAGFGGYPATFRKTAVLADGSRLYLTDSAGPASYFFASKEWRGGLDPAAVVMPKPAGTFRVFIVGESAAKGIPQPRPLRSSAFLETMLSDAWPGRPLEVINLGTTAIAAYPALGILTEALEFSPDLVVVYVGNNEFYGAYGVASLHRAAQSTAVMRLVRSARSLAIAQAIDRVAGRYAARPAGTMMEAMVGRSGIGPGDPARAAAAEHLETFIGDMTERCRARGVPVIVCTPPANERDLAPLGRADVSRLSEAQRGALESTLANAAGSEPVAAEAAARAAISMAPEHATAHYLLAQALSAQGRHEEAGVEYRAAVDLDPMPWRPPSASVEAIRRAVKANGGVLCDLESVFREHSPGGSTGLELLDDHVHPSLRGQALVARAIVESMTGLTGPARVEAGAAAALPGWEVYAERMGANPCDAYAAAHAMRLLGSIEFFRESNPEFLARWESECAAIEASAPGEVAAQLRAWAETAKGAEPAPITALAARAYARLGRAEEAARYFGLAARSSAPYGLWDVQYTYLALSARARELSEEERAEALAAIVRGRVLVETGGDRAGLARLFIGGLHQLRGEMQESIAWLESAAPKLEGENREAAEAWLARARQSRAGTGPRAGGS